MWGGFTGDGLKTVLPAVSHAKVSCRLVPGQLPADILSKVEAHLKRNAPTGLPPSPLHLFPHPFSCCRLFVFPRR